MQIPGFLFSMDMEQARRHAEHWKQMQEQNLGLLFWGKPGNGKTFAAGCIANALLEMDGLHGPSVKMTTFGTILGSSRECPPRIRNSI